MTPKSSPLSPLQQAAQISHMERGKISILRQGPNGPYYNHQYRANGKNISRYLPQDQVAAVQEAIDGYAQFQQLVGQHVDQVVTQTRAEIGSGKKKRQSPRTSSWPKTRKSNS